MIAGLLAGGLVLPRPAAATPGLPAHLVLRVAPQRAEIARAEAQLEQGEFEEAVKTVEAGLDAPDVTDDELVELYRLLGLISLYLGDEERAREAYEKLLQARSDFELPRNTPPKLRNLFARIKDDIKSRRVRPVTLKAEPLRDMPGGQALVVRIGLQDMALGARARFFYRRAGAQAYSSVDFIREGRQQESYVATLPAYELPQLPAAYQVEYYLEVVDAAQRRLAGRGDAFNPLVFQIQAAPSEDAVQSSDTPWYQSPWPWVVVGAVAVGATAGAVVYATSQERGRVTLNIRVTP